MEFDIDEALRYLGVGKKAPDELRQQVAATAEALTASVRPRYIYRVYDLECGEGQISLCGSGVILSGRTALEMLRECGRAVLLACTLGYAFDARLTAMQARDMARAVILDVCGSVLVESGCDAAEQEIAELFPSCYLTDRFSPGYGDLPLSLQPDLCAALDAERRLGVHVTESLLMNPVKSVTAVIGLSDRPQMARIRGCAYCQMRETCALRGEGKHCGN